MLANGNVAKNEIVVDFETIIRYNMTRLGHTIQKLHFRDDWDGVTVDVALVSATHS